MATHYIQDGSAQYYYDETMVVKFEDGSWSVPKKFNATSLRMPQLVWVNETQRNAAEATLVQDAKMLEAFRLLNTWELVDESSAYRRIVGRFVDAQTPMAVIGQYLGYNALPREVARETKGGTSTSMWTVATVVLLVALLVVVLLRRK